MKSSTDSPSQGTVVHQPVGSTHVTEVAIVPVPEETRKMRRVGWAHDTARYCSYIQMGIGTLCVILQLTGCIIGIGGAEHYTGIWAGLVYIITGLGGYFAAKIKSTLRIVFYMAFNYVILILIFIPAMTFTGVAIQSDYAIKTWREFNSVLMVIHILMAIIALIASSLSCHAACCINGCCSCTCLDTDAEPSFVPKRSPQQQVVYVPATQGNTGSPPDVQVCPVGGQYIPQPAHSVHHQTQESWSPREFDPTEVHPTSPPLSSIDPPPSYDTVAMEILQESKPR